MCGPGGCGHKFSTRVRLVHGEIVDNWDRTRGPSLNANPMARTQTVITLLSETTRVVLESVGSDLVRGVLDAREEPAFPSPAKPGEARDH